jgi:hypothetical protein
MQFELDGKVVNQTSPYLNVYNTFSGMQNRSTGDVQAFGFSDGEGDKLDNPLSLRYNVAGVSAVVGAVGGNGLVNSSPFASPSNAGDQSQAGPQASTTYNDGFYSRLSNIAAVTATQQASGLLAIEGVNQMANEFRSFTQTSANLTQYFSDTCTIRLKDVMDSFGQIPMTRRFSGVLRLYINTGSFAVTASYADRNAGTGMNCNMSGAATSFINTCPLLLSNLISPETNYLAATYTAGGGTGTALTGITCGLFIVRPTTTSVSVPGSAPINLAATGAVSSPMNQCRIYYPLIKIKPERLSRYISENRSKTVCYTDVLQTTIANIGASGNFSQLIMSGVTRIRGLLIVPFISGAVYGQMTTLTTQNVPFSPLLSPFDCAPCQTGPISLTNLNVSVAGVNVQQNLMQYGFQQFLFECSEYSKISSSDRGLTNGLINYRDWQQSYRPYYFDCTRATAADALSPRNITLTGVNNSLVNVDLFIFVEYFREFIIDVETGITTM